MSDLLNTNGSDFEFNPDAVDSIDQDSVEGGGPSYPVIQWAYGSMKERKRGGVDGFGGFFVKAEKVDGAAMEAAGWTKTSRTFENGTEEEGYWKREAAISIIAERKRWEINPADGQRQVFPWSGFDKAKEANGGKAPSSRTHYLVLVKGLEQAGPFVLTMKGAAGAAFESYRNANSVISRFANTVIAAGNNASVEAKKKKNEALKAAGKPTDDTPAKKWAYRAFWVPVGANRDDKGDPIFTTVGKAPNTTNVVLPIALGLPDKAAQIDAKVLGRFYVGNDLLTTVNTLYDEAAEWRNAWTADGGAAANGDTTNGDPVAAASTAVKDAEDAALAATGL